MKAKSLRLIIILVVGLFVSTTGMSAQCDTPLCFTAQTPNATVTLTLNSVFSQNVIFHISRTNNGTDWSFYTRGTTISLPNVGDKVYFKVGATHSESYGTFNPNNCSHFTFTGTIAASGNIMSLYGPGPSYPTGFLYRLTFGGYIYINQAFAGLFENCSTLVSAPELPATDLSYECYKNMFSGCTSLSIAPALPTTNLGSGNCYSGMFNGCTSLTSPPALPATTLSGGCYAGMFSGCTSLSVAPTLPATDLSTSSKCYAGMFSGCTSLTTPPALPATTLSNNCYASMFSGCTSLTTAPVLPAINLSDSCYLYMFMNCSSLTSPPALPGTPVSHCYDGMFSGCTSLTTPPALNSMHLAEGCYNYMFSGCTSLTSTPTLPATYLENNCYGNMFANCSSLVSAPALPATSLANYCYGWMFSGCTSLTSTPTLPAVFLRDYCYNGMFSGCTSLTSATTLPATTMTNRCYSFMFQDCTSLDTAPALPSINLANSCYFAMFQGCTSLTTVQSLPATILTDNCYNTMFQNCSSLINIPNITIDMLATGCCTSMFSQCQNLIVDTMSNTCNGSTLSISATTTPSTQSSWFAWNRDMFYGCSGTYANNIQLSSNYCINHYVEPTYSITVLSNDTSYGNVSSSASGLIYDSVITIAASANPHYHFVSWSNGDTNAVTTIHVVSDTTIVATFAVDRHTVLLNSNDTIKGNALGGGTYNYGQNVYVAAISNDHYHFVSWSNGAMTSSMTITVLSDTTLTATFANDQHTVIANCNDTTMGKVSGSGTYEYEQYATLTAIANNHYHFVNWSNGMTTPSITILVNGDMTLTATFAIDQHIVTVNSNDATMGDVTGGGTFDYGQTATLTATANEHYHFVSWSNGLTSPTITITVSGDTTLTATFEADVYNVTATANYASRGTVTGSGQYSYLDRATLTAMPNEGYIFTGWSNGESNQTIYITVECDTAITAIFEEETTAVDDVEESRNIIIAPNPVKVGETICIKGDFTDEEMDGMVVEILGTDGTLASRTTISTTPIELDGINVVGTYIVRITTGTGKVYVEKLMVK